MKKELYDEIITIASENELAGIIRTAWFDPDITPDDFTSLSLRYVTVKRKCEEIGK